MDIGQMDKQISILKPKTQTGAVISLKDEDKWDCDKPFYKLWAKVEYLKGQEYYAAMTVNAETSLRFITWYRKDIDTTMAIKYQNTIYNITSVNPLDYAKTWLVIIAKEVKPSE